MNTMNSFPISWLNYTEKTLQRPTEYPMLQDGELQRPTEYLLQLRKYSNGRQNACFH